MKKNLFNVRLMIPDSSSLETDGPLKSLLLHSNPGWNRLAPVFVRRLRLLMFMLLISGHAFAVDPQSLYKDAGSLYKAGKFQEALTLYDSIYNSGYQSEELAFNIGNCWFKLHKVPMAVLWYERAYRQNPGDEEITYNLALAQSMLVDKLEKIPGFFLTGFLNHILHSRSSDGWAWLALFFFISFLLLLLLFLFSIRMGLRKVALPLSLLVLVLGIYSITASVKQKRFTESRSEAIIMTPSVTLKSAPDEGGTDLFILHEGTKVSIEDSVALWKEIRISDGNKGWIKTADLAVI